MCINIKSEHRPHDRFVRLHRVLFTFFFSTERIIASR